jgi:2-keto-4-pentenoate hydratase/2-oxohepta-3-ene-1,7-dioic acid hydratase in catechol pathway
MKARIRFTRDLNAPATLPDASGLVEYFDLDTAVGAFPADIRLLPPCSPSKIVCVGRNYAEHAAELGNDVPAEPLIFLKPPSSLIAHGDPIVYPPLSQNVNFEGEVALVIGQRARNVPATDAFEIIAGYTCLNDVTARDLQKKDGQWTRGKGFDTFCPVGPWMIYRDQVNFDSLRVETRVNGEIKQDASVGLMIFSVPRIIEYVTQFLTLEPGDLIATGTPKGVAPIIAGDSVSVTVTPLGTLTNPVIAA